MAVGSNLLIYSTLLVATRFLVLHSLIYRTDYMCNHDHFILQATGPPDNFEHSAWKILNQTSLVGLRFLDAHVSFVLPPTSQALMDLMDKKNSDLGPVSRKFRNFSGDIILFVSSKRRCSVSRNLAVILIFTTYEKTSVTK